MLAHYNDSAITQKLALTVLSSLTISRGILSHCAAKPLEDGYRLFYLASNGDYPVYEKESPACRY